MFLETKTKFLIRSPSQDRPITADNFFNWSNQHMYRTSYNDMGFLKSPPANKNYAIPKYQGYIPGKVANNEFGASLTAVSRRVFSPEKLDKPSPFASTGFNWKQLPRQDDTLTALSHKYGKQTIMKAHPAIGDPQMTTTFRQAFPKPEIRLKPNLRTSASCRDLQFDPQMRESWRPATTASGFYRNHQLCDGKTWVPEKVLHTDMVRTEYRKRFNQEKPFHKMTLRASTGMLKTRTLVYDKE